MASELAEDSFLGASYHSYTMDHMATVSKWTLRSKRRKIIPAKALLKIQYFEKLDDYYLILFSSSHIKLTFPSLSLGYDCPVIY